MNTLTLDYNRLADILMVAAEAYHTQAEPVYNHAARERLDAEGDAVVRAVAMMCERHSSSDAYRECFRSIKEELKADMPAGRIAFRLLETYGTKES